MQRNKGLLKKAKGGLQERYLTLSAT